MKKKSKDEIFESIQVNIKNEGELINEISDEEIRQYNEYLFQENMFNEIFENLPFGKSEFFKIYCRFGTFLEQRKINKENLNDIFQDKVLINAITIFINLEEKLFINEPNPIKKLLEFQAFILNYLTKEKLSGINVKTQEICSIFFDYVLIKELNLIVKDSDPLLNQSFSEILANFYVSLTNAANLIEVNLDELVNKKITILSGVKIILIEKMIVALKDSVRPILELNELFFDNTLNKEILLAFAKFINDLSLLDVGKMQFEKLIDHFDEENQLNHSRKMLFIHDVFLFFGHPEAMTEVEEEKYFDVNEKSSIYGIEQKKIRIAERLINFCN